MWCCRWSLPWNWDVLEHIHVSKGFLFSPEVFQLLLTDVLLSWFTQEQTVVLLDEEEPQLTESNKKACKIAERLVELCMVVLLALCFSISVSEKYVMGSVIIWFYICFFSVWKKLRSTILQGMASWRHCRMMFFNVIVRMFVNHYILFVLPMDAGKIHNLLKFCTQT